MLIDAVKTDAITCLILRFHSLYRNILDAPAGCETYCDRQQNDVEQISHKTLSLEDQSGPDNKVFSSSPS